MRGMTGGSPGGAVRLPDLSDLDRTVRLDVPAGRDHAAARAIGALLLRVLPLDLGVHEGHLLERQGLRALRGAARRYRRDHRIGELVFHVLQLVATRAVQTQSNV